MRYELLIGTRKGLVIGTAGAERQNWEFGPLEFSGWAVDYAIRDPHNGCLWAATTSMQWGPHLQRSHDSGQTWEYAGGPSLQGYSRPKYEFNLEKGDFDNLGEQPASVARIWTVESAPNGVLWAGADPGALFRSDDHGQSWQVVESLWNHESRDAWMPGGGGMMVHHILVDPADPDHVYVAVSAAGTFETKDGGKSWAPRNRGVKIPFMPDPDVAVGHCVHSLCMAPGGRLYQQNHDGTYVSRDGGLNWEDIAEGLPGRFGFASATDAHDADTYYVVPLESDQNRVPPGGKLCVYRTRDAGKSWQPLSKGLPQAQAYPTILRQALAADGHENLGLYLGTGGGEVYQSLDEGERWTPIAEHLASVNSVRVSVVD